ncbi:MAG: RHS domain-containing protein, partial [Candidatus Helarchaeota archaeon]
MLTQITKTQNNSEEIYYYHNDHLGTPKVMTSQAGNVVWEAIYQPFGEIDRYLNAKV